MRAQAWKWAMSGRIPATSASMTRSSQAAPSSVRTPPLARCISATGTPTPVTEACTCSSARCSASRVECQDRRLRERSALALSTERILPVPSWAGHIPLAELPDEVRVELQGEVRKDVLLVVDEDVLADLAAEAAQGNPDAVAHDRRPHDLRVGPDGLDARPVAGHPAVPDDDTGRSGYVDPHIAVGERNILDDPAGVLERQGRLGAAQHRPLHRHLAAVEHDAGPAVAPARVQPHQAAARVDRQGALH